MSPAICDIPTENVDGANRWDDVTRNGNEGSLFDIADELIHACLAPKSEPLTLPYLF